MSTTLSFATALNAFHTGGLVKLLSMWLPKPEQKQLKVFTLTHRDPQVLVAMSDRLTRTQVRKANSIDVRASAIFNDRFNVFMQMLTAAQNLLADPKGKHKGHTFRVIVEGDFDTTPFYVLEMIWTKTNVVVASTTIDGL